jgi:prevent-host-death family protein
MKRFTATEAKNQFGEMLDVCVKEPVSIQKNGRDIAVIMSRTEYDRITNASSRNGLVKLLHEESMQRYASVYEALAK